MPSMMSQSTILKIETVDLSFFITTTAATGTNTTSATGEAPSISKARRLSTAKALVEACHRLGFVKVTGHGVSKQELDQAFAWTKALFDLPYEDKMKAPHPPTNMPHRGYSGLGVEKVYSKDEATSADKTGGDASKNLRTISDYKESYEVGSEEDDQQPNIWLPEDVLPEFRSYATSLYQRLAGVSGTILEAIGLGLGLGVQDCAALMDLFSAQHSQLRLLHYPEISRQWLETEMVARLPAHTDWGTFTIVFQDDRGGLELRDPRTGVYVPADPEGDGALVLNVGDMLQRFTNDFFVSALHRVSIPNPVPEEKRATAQAAEAGGAPARYSIPFFVTPAPTRTVATSPRFITESRPAKYEPVRFDEYGALISRYQYQGQAKQADA